MDYAGYTGKYLEIDLTHRDFRSSSLKKRDLELFLGGKGLAAKMLFDALEVGIEALSPQNLLIVTTGPLTGSGAPCSSRFNISAKSPMTGGIASSNCGGNFGIHLKKAGYDALVIRGKASQPVWLEIEDQRVTFHEAQALWGLDTEKAQERMPGKGGRLAIGPAGENLVRFACILSGERAAGRCGLGAVMGAKKLKGILARGSHKVTIARPAKFKRLVQKWIQALRAHPITGTTLPQLGTASLVRPSNASHTLPYRNFFKGFWPQADAVSGERLAADHLIKNIGCTSCPIRCGRQVRLQNGKAVKGPEFETIGMFGPNIANPDLSAICEWNYRMDLLGLDTITTGSTIACAMELAEKGKLPLNVAFGNIEALGELIEDIAYRRGIGAELAEGSLRLAQKYGERELAMQSKGLEFAAYNPRGAVGHGLGYATSNRGGCHLNGGYLIYFEALGPVTMDPLTLKAKPAYCIFQQNALEAVGAAGSCIFTTYAAVPGFVEKLVPPGSKAAALVSKLLIGSRLVMNFLGHLRPWMIPLNVPLIPHSQAIRRLTGMPFSLGKFLSVGERCFTLERLFNLREGLGGETDSLPRRLTAQGYDDPHHAAVRLDRMLPQYYRIRRWNARGVPTVSLLKKLELDFAIPLVRRVTQSRVTKA